MSLLEVRQVLKRFDGLIAVDGASFEVYENTIKALIGPNGAGKSTLFNVLTAFDSPDEGRIVFDGIDITGFKPQRIVRLGIARTFQNTQLFEEMTALENVMTGAHAVTKSGMLRGAFRLPSAVAEERDIVEEAGRLLRLLGIEQWTDVYASDMPHGLRRLLEIARALATRPRLLCLDEPAAGLNTVETATLAEALYRIRDKGVTIIVVEHDMGLVMEISDEIVVLDRGQKIAEGPPRLIQKDPVVIAAYLGEDDSDDM
ncbi:MAG: ABC transporter ATP-binding protein [Coriobacteriia bacterium]|jgi:branched-chain amino acid transport system ATP-binding protein|nr:ABC transporter ATP-binding protein [Coriobacteriia bacterium]